jgi:hypothetical protein
LWYSSETLRKEQSHDQEHDQCGGQYQTDEVFGVHSLPTAHTVRASSVNATTVTTT